MIELRSADSSARAVILPQYGGRLHQLFLAVDGQETPLLWSPEDPSEYGERPTRGGSFPMAPWPNRIRDGRFTWEGRAYRVPTDGKPHASHGRVFQRAWDVVGSDSGSAELRCPLDDGWPWEGWVEQRFDVANGELRMELSVHAADARFPAGAGWHPWFRRDVAANAEVRARLDAPERYVLVENLPTGNVVPVEGEFDLREGPALGARRLDDCYRGLQDPIEMEWDRVRLRMEVACETPHVQVFTPEYAVAVEPQTCVADAFNLHARGVPGTGVEVVEHGRPLRLATRWRWE